MSLTQNIDVTVEYKWKLLIIVKSGVDNSLNLNAETNLTLCS